MKHKAYSYIRFSTLIQAKGGSYERQIKQARDYCLKNNLELVENIEDLGVSAFKGKNVEEGALGVFIKAVESGKIEKGSYLLVENLDRLSRDFIDNALELLIKITRLSIIVVTLFDNMRYDIETIRNNPTSLLVSLLLMMRAREESETKSKRISARWLQKAEKIKNGEQHIYTRNLPGWLTVKNNRIVVDDEQVLKVQKIFDMYNNGYGFFAIAKMLNNQNVKSFGGGWWDTKAVKRLIKNRAVISKFTPHDYRGEKIEIDYFPKIISESIFYTAQNIAAKRAKKLGGQKTTNNINNIFSGVVKCFKCGKSMIYQRKTKNVNDAVLMCSTYRRTSKCCKNSVNYYVFEKLFFDYVAARKINLTETDNNSRIEYIEKELAIEIEKRNKFEKLVDDVDNINEVFFDACQKNAKRISELEKELEAEKAKTFAKLKNFWQNLKLYSKMLKAENEEKLNMRVKMRAEIQNAFKLIECDFTNRVVLKAKITLTNNSVIHFFEKRDST